MKNSAKLISHDYNVVLIYITDDLHVGSLELIDRLKEKQPLDLNTLTEVSLLHFKGKEVDEEGLVNIIDLIRIYCDSFNASSVYIFGENNQLDSFANAFKDMSNYIKSDCLVKFIKSEPEPNIEDMSIVLFEGK